MSENSFKSLYDVDVTNKIKKKNGLNYLSWASAWAEVKKIYPEAFFTIYERETPDGLIINYFTDGKTCWVKTGVIINGLEHIEELPVMDFKNKSISLESVTSSDVNKAIQRSKVKCCADHGLALYIYEGDDIPEATVQKEEDLKVINKSSLGIATQISKKSEEMKEKVGNLVVLYVPSKNPMEIKDVNKAKELNQKLQELMQATSKTKNN